MKVSGYVEAATQQPAPEDPQHYQPTFLALLDSFGEDRLIFGSNWPVCERSGTMKTIVNAVEVFCQDYPEIEEKIWWRNGQAAYRFSLER